MFGLVTRGCLVVVVGISFVVMIVVAPFFSVVLPVVIVVCGVIVVLVVHLLALIDCMPVIAVVF